MQTSVWIAMQMISSEVQEYKKNEPSTFPYFVVLKNVRKVAGNAGKLEYFRQLFLKFRIDWMIYEWKSTRVKNIDNKYRINYNFSQGVYERGQVSN